MQASPEANRDLVAGEGIAYRTPAASEFRPIVTVESGDPFRIPDARFIMDRSA